MNRNSLAKLVSVSLLLAFSSMAPAAYAQASRTWVSGVGDDANPCSRTAPCKTFAGAISKTAAGGEINALDPGGYGALTITKSITIDGTGTNASILASLSNGIVINAGVNDVVILRNLNINGSGNGLNGIRFLAGAALHLENVNVFGFSREGLEFAPAGNSELFVKDSTFKKNLVVGAGGVLIVPGALGTAFAVFENVRLENNRYGMRVESRSNVTVRNSVAAGNINNGFLVYAPLVVGQLSIDSSNISANGGDPTSAGAKSEGAGAVVRIANSLISDNSVGVLPQSGGAIISFGNNQLAGNGTDGNPTSTIATR